MTRERQTDFASVNGTRLYYELQGEGRPVVFIHAGIADCRMWDDQWQALVDRYTMVRYDLRGFGRSELPELPFSHTDDLASLLAYLGVDHPVVVGCSMGGALAIDYTLEYQEDVAALVAVGAGLSGFEYEDPVERAQWSAIAEAGRRGDHDEAAELILRMWLDGVGRPAGSVRGSVRERAREMAGDLGRRGEPPEGKLIEPQAAGRLVEITVPTLVLVGDHDLPSIQAVAEKLISEVAGARKTVIEGTAHLPNMERPDYFNQVLG
ncbi:MAG: alpha/beta fold hydrolase, partial [Chloroflexota bacterium]